MNKKNISALKQLKYNLILFSLMGLLGVCTYAHNNKQEDNSNIESTTNQDESLGLDLPNNDIDEILGDSRDFEEEFVNSLENIMDIINTGSIQKVYYVTENTSINIPSFLSVNNVNEYVIIPKLECLEVYAEVDNSYLVKTNEYIGYVKKEKLEELTGNFVVVDISSQEVKLYSDNQVILTTPVVTGKPSTPSDKGIFEIYDISSSRYLVGPGYKSYVDIMMKYNGGEGLHDAEYHKHENGFRHGWRDISEFGGETYLTDGSHGCINMPHEAAMTVRDVDIGTKVLVKE